jgi:hypothetical protein
MQLCNWHSDVSGVGEGGVKVILYYYNIHLFLVHHINSVCTSPNNSGSVAAEDTLQRTIPVQSPWQLHCGQALRTICYDAACHVEFTAEENLCKQGAQVIIKQHY